MRLRTSLIAVVFAVCGTVLHAQTFEETMSRAQGQVGDISKYQQALQDPDPRMQYALVQEMLKLPDPALQRIAKEHALFSTNPVMREAAIKAILDSGTTLRLQLAGSRDAAPFVFEWVRTNGGTYLENQGQVLIRVNEPLSADCWGFKTTCVFRQVGTAVQFTPYFPNRRELTSVMNLGNDGILRGSLNYAGAELVQVQIDLKE